MGETEKWSYYGQEIEKTNDYYGQEIGLDLEELVRKDAQDKYMNEGELLGAINMNLGQIRAGEMKIGREMDFDMNSVNTSKSFDDEQIVFDKLHKARQSADRNFLKSNSDQIDSEQMLFDRLHQTHQAMQNSDYKNYSAFKYLDSTPNFD